MRQDTREPDDASARLTSADGTDDPFPSLDRERRDLDRITQRMMDARDEWEPPEKPEYDPESRLQPAYKTATVRSISHITKNGGDSHVRLRVDDNQSHNPIKVDIKDTGEQSISNPWVRFLKMYGVHPEMPEDLYGMTIELKGRRDKACIRPVILPVRLMWDGLWMPHFRYRLVALDTDANSYSKLHPTKRFFPAYLGMYGALYAGFHVATTVLGETVGGAVLWLGLALLTIATFIGTCWGLYYKVHRDWLPYLSKRAARILDIYTHRRA